MDDALSVFEIEETLRRHGISAARMCREAGISQSTWHKLKFQGTSPRESTRRVIRAAVAELIGPSDGRNKERSGGAISS